MKRINLVLFLLLLLGVSFLQGGRDCQAEEKSPAKGIFCLVSGSRKAEASPDLELMKFWDFEYVDGVRLRTFWDKIEPQPGQYDWSHIDEGLRLAQRNGKSISFSIGAGMATPEWVYSNGVKKFSFTPPNNPGTGQFPGQKVMPLPWDESFLAHWGNFIRTTAERYDGNPRVAYIVMAGFGPLIETYLVKAPQDVKRIQSMGGMEKWVSAGKRIIDLYAESFEKTPFILAMGQPIRTSEGRESLLKVIQYGLQKYPGRFGVMHCSLGSRTSFNDDLIRSSSSTNPVGLQFVWSTTGRNAKWLSGSLAQSLDHAIEIKANFVEVYASDCKNPEYSSDLSKASKSLKGR